MTPVEIVLEEDEDAGRGFYEEELIEMGNQDEEELEDEEDE